jgi:hypothetical protein
MEKGKRKPLLLIGLSFEGRLAVRPICLPKILNFSFCLILIFLVFLDRFDVLMLKINLKK